MAEVDDEWLTQQRSPHSSGFSERIIYRLIDEGKLPAVRWPVRVRRSNLEVVEALPVEAPLVSAHARCQDHFEGSPAYYDGATFGERCPVPFPPWALGRSCRLQAGLHPVLRWVDVLRVDE